jgi:hypothetical protein
MSEEARDIVQLDFSLISFLVSLLSLVLGGFAIWLSLFFKREADRVNEKTLEMLIDIRTDAKAISAFAVPELTKYGEASRQIILGNTPSAQVNFQMTSISPTEPEEHPNASNR